MDLLYTALGFLGPISLVGLWIVFMVNKKGWTIIQVVAGGLFALLLVSSFPALPQATHDGVQGFITAFSK